MFDQIITGIVSIPPTQRTPPTPLEIPIELHTFSSKFLALQNPPSPGNSNPFFRGSLHIFFWNCTMGHNILPPVGKNIFWRLVPSVFQGCANWSTACLVWPSRGKDKEWLYCWLRSKSFSSENLFLSAETL